MRLTQLLSWNQLRRVASSNAQMYVNFHLLVMTRATIVPYHDLMLIVPNFSCVHCITPGGYLASLAW